MEKITRNHMTKKLITIGWKDTIVHADSLMREHRIRHLPVYNDTDEIIGMLSDRDVQRALLGGTQAPHFDKKAEVRDYMNFPVEAIDHQTNLKWVAKKMIHDKISALMVKRGLEIVGIITTEDLLFALVELLEKDGSSDKLSLENLFLKHFPQATLAN